MSSSSKNARVIATPEDKIWLYQNGNLLPGMSPMAGQEIENHLYFTDTCESLTYHGRNGRPGIIDVLRAFEAQGFDLTLEKSNPIFARRGNDSVSLERGGQIELDAGPHVGVARLTRALRALLEETMDICNGLGVGILAMGYHPKLEDPKAHLVAPKERYNVLAANWDRSPDPKAGYSMMSGTSGLQLSFGWGETEQDMIETTRIAVAMAPVIAALYNNSPYKEGEFSGYQSWRNHNNDMIMDGRRYGELIPDAFHPGFGFKMLVDYCIRDFHMLGVYDRKDVFHDAKDASFQEFIDGKLDIDGFRGQRATVGDLANFINTVYLGARPRGSSTPGAGTIEMRTADMAPLEMTYALAALVMPLMHDRSARKEALEFIEEWAQDREQMRREVSLTGLQTPVPSMPGLTANDLAKRFIMIAEKRLTPEEARLLEPLKEIVHGDSGLGRNWAQIQLERYGQKPDMDQVMRDMDQTRGLSIFHDYIPASQPRTHVYMPSAAEVRRYG